MSLAPALVHPNDLAPANDATSGPVRAGALRPGREAETAGGPTHDASADAPALVRLLQFLLEAPTADAVLHRATVSLGLLAEVAWAELDGGEPADLRFEFAARDGVPHRIDVALNDGGDARARAAVVGMLTLVDQVHRRQDEIERLRAEATTDPLTGLWNRRGFEPLLDQALARAARTGESIAIVLIDVDRFKQVNDEFGHGAGDEALVAVAAAMQGGIRPTDVAARTGGDEFAILLSGADAQGATLVCERIRRSLRRASGSSRGVTLSFGVADLASVSRPTAGPSVRSAWLAAADAALYEAKAAGRDGVACYGDAPRIVEDDTTRPLHVCAS